MLRTVTGIGLACGIAVLVAAAALASDPIGDPTDQVIGTFPPTATDHEPVDVVIPTETPPFELPPLREPPDTPPANAYKPELPPVPSDLLAYRRLQHAALATMATLRPEAEAIAGVTFRRGLSTSERASAIRAAEIQYVEYIAEADGLHGGTPFEHLDIVHGARPSLTVTYASVLGTLAELDALESHEAVWIVDVGAFSLELVEDSRVVFPLPRSHWNDIISQGINDD